MLIEVLVTSMHIKTVHVRDKQLCHFMIDLAFLMKCLLKLKLVNHALNGDFALFYVVFPLLSIERS